MDLISQQASVRGRVQGVGFRAYTRRCARELSVAGHVGNAPDGSVFILARAAPPVLREFWDLIRQGPPMSRVDQLLISETGVIPVSDHFDIVF